jgi:hypothetical protein
MLRAVGRATAGSIDPYGPSGMNVYAAQSLTTGDPNVIVAYVEGGINWYGNDASTLAPSVYVNWQETPVPCVGSTMWVNGTTETCATIYSSNEDDYDVPNHDCVQNHDCVISVTDWASDPRVHPHGGLTFLTPEDLIAAFSGPGFTPPVEDPAGFPHAISGWDFYDNQDDPATVDGAYNHANDQMEVVHTICPKCRILPVKAGDEALDTSDSLARAWLFAAESGARVIVSVTADLGYSTFARTVLSYIEARGIVVVEASNDFDTPDHQGGMFWNGALAGNGLVANTTGLPQSVWSQGSVPGPYWTRSDLTSWGPHAQFSVATQGGSTSESTPTLGGVMALLLSYGNLARAKGVIPSSLTGPEAVSVLAASCTQPPGAPAGAWNEQYGYGMPDVLAAMDAIAAGDVSPGVTIKSPTWYSVYDPTHGGSISVAGGITAEPGQAFSWQLQYGLGGDPATWDTLASGSGSGSFQGTFGALPLSAVPVAFWGRGFAATPTGLMPAIDQYTVTFRVVVSDAGPGPRALSGEARMAVAVFHDPSAVQGFPMPIGSSGESQPALVDLQGTGRLDIVFGTANGLVEAIDPLTGKELPGWPAHTDPLPTGGVPGGAGIVVGDEPVFSDIAVGDLFHTGRLDVVATSSSGRVYAFDPTGHLLPGWPVTLSDGVVPPAVPRPDLANVRLPVLGASAPPVLAPLLAGGRLAVVQSGWDGYLYALAPTGTPLPGWPVQVALPAGTTPPPGYTLELDHKLDTPPAVAYFTKGGPPDLVVRSQYTEFNAQATLQAVPFSFTFAFQAGGKPVAGWPVRLSGAIEDYGSAQEEITEGTDAPVAADALGTGVDEVAVNPVWTPPYLLSGAGKVLGSYGSIGGLAGLFEALLSDAGALDALAHKLPPGVSDLPFPFASSGAFGDLNGKLAYLDPEIGAWSMGASLLYPGSENHINTYTSAWPADPGTNPSGGQLHGFPMSDQGQSFLGAPIDADVSGGGTTSVVVGGDASAVNATLPDGLEAPGFPKFTGGWTTYAPSTGDLFGTGRTDLVGVTRDGYLFAWSTGGSDGSDDQWWRAGHDEYNSGNYGMATRPPGVVRDPVWVPGTSVLNFIAPGARWYDGTTGYYSVVYRPSGRTAKVAATVAAGSLQSLAVPTGTTSVQIQAVGPTGLLGGAVTVTPGEAGAGKAVEVSSIAGGPGGDGYWELSRGGGVYSFGLARYHGNVTASSIADPAVGIAATPDGGGYWIATASGQVSAFGDAKPWGSVKGRLTAPIVAIAATPDGQGYWLAASDGGVFAFGSAKFHGSMGGRHLNRPIVGMAGAPDGRGYWLVATDGGIFTFGSARFHGSTGGTHLNRPIVGMAPAVQTGGYWLVASDGGIFGFDAPFVGSAGAATLPAQVTGMVPTPGTIAGYRLATEDGAVFTFGPFAGIPLAG